MAVFKLNICKFNNCDLIFNNLENLIRHIETNHISKLKCSCTNEVIF